MRRKPRFECDVCGANRETVRCGAKGCDLMACLDCLKRHEPDCIARTDERNPQDHARDLAEKIAAIFDSTWDRQDPEIQQVAELIADHTASQLAGAVPQETLKTSSHFAEFIKEEMDERIWSVRDLAIRMHWKEIGITILAIQMLMSCREVTLDDEYAERMALAFGVSKEFLVNLDKSCRQSRESAGLPLVDPKTPEQTHQPGAVPQEELRELLYRCIKELDYVQSAEHISQCASAEGKELIELGMKLLGVQDLSLESLVEKRRVK